MKTGHTLLDVLLGGSRWVLVSHNEEEIVSFHTKDVPGGFGPLVSTTREGDGV